MYIIRFVTADTRLYGPFKTVKSAEAWAKKKLTNSNWMIQRLSEV